MWHLTYKQFDQVAQVGHIFAVCSAFNEHWLDTKQTTNIHFKFFADTKQNFPLVRRIMRPDVFPNATPKMRTYEIAVFGVTLTKFL